MTCKKCGAPLDGTSKFCGVCGAPVEVENNPQPSQPTLSNIFETKEPAAATPVPSTPAAPSAPAPVPSVPTEPLTATPVSAPAAPSAPAEPSAPAAPSAPIAPSAPVEPVAPAAPSAPIAPSAPVEPAAPAAPSAPAEPTAPAAPSAPAAPVAPKKSGGGKGAVAVLIAIVGIALIGFLVWNFCLKSSGGSIDNLKKAFANVETAGKDSATVKAYLNVKGQDASQSINFLLTTKVAKVNDKLDFEIKLDKSMFLDEIDVFGSISKDSIGYYLPSSIVDMMSGTVSTNDVWLKYEKTLEELGVDSSELDFISSGDATVDYDKIFNKDTVKYVGKKDGLQQYQLIINKDLINKIVDAYKSMEGFEEYASILESGVSEMEEALKGLSIYLYVNDKDELTKMSVIYSTDELKQNGITEIELTMEFVDLGTTTVTIPSEALNSAIDLESYIEENSSYDFDDSPLSGIEF